MNTVNYHPSPKEGKSDNNYRTTNLTSHPSMIRLGITLTQLHPQVEEIIAEEQPGFKRWNSTLEHIFNLRLLKKKYQNDQKSIFHIFIRLQ